MNLWKLITQIFSWGDVDNDRSRSRHLARFESLDEADVLESRGAHSRFITGADAIPHSRAAEILHVPFQQRFNQTTRSQRKIIRLSVAVVDYLLEREWFSLLGRHGKSRSNRRRDRRGTRQSQHSAAQTDFGDEFNRTVATSDSDWSIITTIEPGTPPNLTSTDSIDPPE